MIYSYSAADGSTRISSTRINMWRCSKAMRCREILVNLVISSSVFSCIFCSCVVLGTFLELDEAGQQIVPGAGRGEGETWKGCSFYLIGVKKKPAALESLRVFSLERSTAEAFAVSFKVLRRKRITGAGAYYCEPATPIINQCNDIFTDQYIFRYFPSK